MPIITRVYSLETGWIRPGGLHLFTERRADELHAAGFRRVRLRWLTRTAEMSVRIAAPGREQDWRAIDPRKAA